jgi:hypothetical protein
MSLSIGLGTHLPVLMRAMELSYGRVAEVGAGFFSTPYLHWQTYLQHRKLVTFENDLNFIKHFDRYKTDWHDIVPVTDWEDIDLSGEWGVALIDHAPAERRIQEIMRLAWSCDFIVVHDTEGRRENHYHYQRTLAEFEYRKDFTLVRPHTCVVSNRVALDSLIIW